MLSRAERALMLRAFDDMRCHATRYAMRDDAYALASARARPMFAMMSLPSTAAYGDAERHQYPVTCASYHATTCRVRVTRRHYCAQFVSHVAPCLCFAMILLYVRHAAKRLMPRAAARLCHMMF